MLQFSLSAAERGSPVADFEGVVDVDALGIFWVGDVFVVRYENRKVMLRGGDVP